MLRGSRRCHDLARCDPQGVTIEALRRPKPQLHLSAFHHTWGPFQEVSVTHLRHVSAIKCRQPWILHIFRDVAFPACDLGHSQRVPRAPQQLEPIQAHHKRPIHQRSKCHRNPELPSVPTSITISKLNPRYPLCDTPNWYTHCHMAPNPRRLLQPLDRLLFRGSAAFPLIHVANIQSCSSADL